MKAQPMGIAMPDDTVDIDALLRGLAVLPDRKLLWTAFVKAMGCRQVAEIGVWKGAFALALLQGCPDVSLYTLIDPWRNLPQWNKPWNKTDQEFDAIFAEAGRLLAPFAARTRWLRNETKAAVREIPDDSLDFIYVDGDHTLRGITIDLISSYRTLRPGGWLAGDDFTPSVWQHGREYEPTLVSPFAVYFAEAVGAAFWVLPMNQFLLRKPAASPGRFRVTYLTPDTPGFDLRSRL